MAAGGGESRLGDHGRPAAVTETGAEITGLVVAARDGDRAAAAALMAAHLPMLYRIVGRALDGHADVDDVVQETVLRAHRDLPSLRAPESFRSWLVAIATRQISSRLRAWQQERDRTSTLEDATRIPDPEAEFADVTLLRLGLSAQRRQVTRAAGWLDPDDQELAALWWQELTGGRTRAELAAALGIGAAHARVRVQRMRNQLELCRQLVAALETEPPCPQLEALTEGWNGMPSPRWRKRFARHLRGCDRCGQARSGLVPLERLLLGGSLVLLPPAAANPLSAGTAAAGDAGGWLTQFAAAKTTAVVMAGAVVSGAVYLALPDVPVVQTRGVAAPALADTRQFRTTVSPSASASRVVIRPAGRPDAAVDLDGDALVVVTGTPGLRLTVVTGLADPQCLSLRSTDGRYVRHASFRIVLSDADEGRLFREDATFCTRPGPAAGTIQLTSANYPDRLVHAQDGRLRLDPAETGAAYLEASTFALTGV